MKFTIRGLPKMANGSHGHWSRTANERKKWQALVARELAGQSPCVPYKKIRVTFTRHSSVQPDFDGLVHGFKPVRDALVTFGFIEDDKDRFIDAVYKWEKAPQKKGCITVEIEPLERYA